MIPARPFLMIRHGESEANVRQIFSGHVHVALTKLGREQAHAAGKLIAGLPEDWRPKRIVHSHLSRARDTAAIINGFLGNLPMHETPDIAEQNFGDWEGQRWEDVRPYLQAGDDPLNGESHSAFGERVKSALNDAMSAADDLPLIVCHGGVFRAFAGLYGQEMIGVVNCVPYRFAPRVHDYPWDIAAITESA